MDDTIYLVQNEDHKTVFRTYIRRNAERKLSELFEATTATGDRTPRILPIPANR